MKEKLIELLYYYVKNEQYADYLFVTKAIEIVISEKNLYEYIRGIDFFKYRKETIEMSYYDPLSKIIGMDIDNAMKLRNRDFSNLEKLLSPKEKVLQYNLAMLGIILHESEHANQYKTLDVNNNQSVEQTLIKCGLGDETVATWYNFKLSKAYNKFLNLSNKQYSKFGEYYFSNPIERLAEIKANKLIREIAYEVTSDKDKYIKDHFDYIYLHYLTRGYHEMEGAIMSPLEKYINIKESLATRKGIYIRTKDYSSLIINPPLCLTSDQKFLYGLPVNYDELEQKEIEKTKTKAFQLLLNKFSNK